MCRLTALLSVLLLFPLLLFSYPYNSKKELSEDIYHIDSIAKLFYIDPFSAMERIDSLYSYCEAYGYKNCSRAKLEAFRCKFFLETQDNANAMKSAFACINAESDDPESDRTWKLLSLSSVCHQYIKVQNWFFVSKYLIDLDEMAKEGEESCYYQCVSSLLKALMLTMQNKPDEAMAMIDGMPDVLANDSSAKAPERAILIKCRALQYRGCVNGFSGRYAECRENHEDLIELLSGSERGNIDDYTANGYLLYSYSYLGNLCSHTGDFEAADRYYDLAMRNRTNLPFYDKSTRSMADYLYNRGRYEELDSLLLPVLDSERSSTAILHEIDHLYKLRIRSLYKRGLYKEAAPWVERFMNATLELFLEKGRSGMDIFMFAYEAEVAKVKMLEQEKMLYKADIRVRTLVVLLLLSAVIALGFWLLFKMKQRDNRFLYDRVNEVNRAYEKLSQAMIVSHDEEKKGEDVNNKERLTYNKERLTYNRVHKFLTEDKRFLDCLLSADDVQRECGVSYSTMNRHLSELTGMTFNAYLNHLSLEFACKLLSDTDKTVDVVAQESGFATNRTFMRQFKDKYNLSPTQFRNINNGDD